MSEDDSTPGTCFVIMPFREPYDSYYERVIEPAVEATGLTPHRGDSLFMSTPIIEDIWREIQSAAILLADLTERNANVFYELGLGHAIGKPVVLISESLDHVPFDLRSLRVLTYDKNHPEWGAKLAQEITDSLKESMAKPVDAVPSMFRVPVKSQAPKESELTLRLATIEGQVEALLLENVERHTPFYSPLTATDDIVVGTPVLHPMFGHGVVKTVDGQGAKRRLTILFQKHGIRKILPAYTKMRARVHGQD